MSPARPRITGNANQQARRIAEKITDAWYQNHGGGYSEIPVGVAAALAIASTPPPGKTGPDMQPGVEDILTGTDEAISRTLALIWSSFWLSRPDLGRLTMPFRQWLDTDHVDPGTAHAAAQVARAAARAGLLDMGQHGMMQGADLLGTVYLYMKADADRQARGEFYTPPEVCRMMAEVQLAEVDLQPGAKIAEPAAGTGGMIRAAAEVLRNRGQEPADYWWVANDIGPVSVAGLAVNCHLWGLGHRAVIGVANTLTEPEWYVEAWEIQQDAFEHREQLISVACAIGAVWKAHALLTGDISTAPDVQPEPEKRQREKVPLGPGIQLSLLDMA